jgi:hypothetical protein
VKKPKPTKRQQQLDALARESDRVERERIRRLLALPPGKRTNFLRKRIGLKGSAL